MALSTALALCLFAWFGLSSANHGALVERTAFASSSSALRDALNDQDSETIVIVQDLTLKSWSSLPVVRLERDVEVRAADHLTASRVLPSLDWALVQAAVQLEPNVTLTLRLAGNQAIRRQGTQGAPAQGSCRPKPPHATALCLMQCCAHAPRHHAMKKLR